MFAFCSCICFNLREKSSHSLSFSPKTPGKCWPYPTILVFPLPIFFLGSFFPSPGSENIQKMFSLKKQFKLWFIFICSERFVWIKPDNLHESTVY